MGVLQELYEWRNETSDNYLKYVKSAEGDCFVNGKMKTNKYKNIPNSQLFYPSHSKIGQLVMH